MRIVQGLFVVAFASAATLVVGCSIARGTATGAGGNSEQTGSFGLDLVVAPGIVIDALSYTIHNPAALASDMTGTVDVSHSQVVRFVIGGLPAADGYTVVLFATTQDGLACVGEPTVFSIVAGQTSEVTTSLVCGPATGETDSGSALVTATVTLGDGESPCPLVTSLSALPSEVDVGGAMELSAAVSLDDAVLAWSSTGSAGALDVASGPSNTFRCVAPGVATITATATLAGSGCAGTASVDVTCDAPVDASLACASSNLGLGGVGLPAGTTVAASDGSNVTVGGPLGVGWAANDYSGFIQFTFPEPIALDGIALSAISLPTTQETYTITGFLQGASVPLGVYADTVTTGYAVSLPPMVFAPGLFDGLRIDVNGESSWVSLDAASLLTADCPAGPGGIYTIGTGILVDGGAPSDAGAPEGSADASEASADAGASTDASGAGGEDASVGEAGVCELPPFPFFGTAEVTGTLAIPGPPSSEVPECAPLSTLAPSQGTVTFSVGPAGCSFTYVDSSGIQYTSNLLSTISSAGDTVTCSVDSTSPPQAYGPCFELDDHEDGLNANVMFSVTRSTGAVSISRLCAWSDAVCSPSTGYVTTGPATSLQLSGSVTCPDGGNLTGVVQCGSGACSTPIQSCCDSTNPLQPAASCVATDNGLCFPGPAVGCDGPESCPPGFVCCPRQLGTAITAATCQARECPITSLGL